MTLAAALELLETLAPLRLAGSWDNVGLLLEGDREVHSALLAIDLSTAVCDEALAADVDLVVAYHPPVFRGLKRLTRRVPLQRSLLRLARAGVHVYSPHSALDAVAGGMNDWLLELFEVQDAGPILPDALDPTVGAGRLATVTPFVPATRIDAIKRHLGVPALRVAGDLDRTVETVAVCPGAGGSVFAGLGEVDLLLTGEMSHHDVLAWAARGTTVVLAEHTHTERAYLPRFAARLDQGGLPTRVSLHDADPLRVV